jgi:hypothetical protein
VVRRQRGSPSDTRSGQGLILLSSAVPGPVPDPIPPLVAKHNFVYLAAVKAAPDSLLGMLMPKSVIQSMSKEDRAEALGLTLLESMPISERTDGIRFDNEVTVPGINDVPFEQVTPPTLIFQAVDDPRENAGGREIGWHLYRPVQQSRLRQPNLGLDRT